MTTSPVGLEPLVSLDFGVGDRLRKARKRTGLSQKEFGRRIGASRNTVIKYERGDIVKAVYLENWAEVAGVSYQELVGGLPNIPPQRPGGGSSGVVRIGCRSRTGVTRPIRPFDPASHDLATAA